MYGAELDKSGDYLLYIVIIEDRNTKPSHGSKPIKLFSL